jgi:hypothetical protein
MIRVALVDKLQPVQREVDAQREDIKEIYKLPK